MFAFFLALIPAIVSLSLAAFVSSVREMPSNRSFSLSWVLPSGVFEQLGNALQQTAQPLDQAVWVLTEATLPVDRAKPARAKRAPAELAQPERLIVVVSRRFSGLLLADAPAAPAQTETCYEVALTFAPEAIAAFLTALSNQLQHEPALAHRLHQASQQLQANDPAMQSEFTLRLADILVTAQPGRSTVIRPALMVKTSSNNSNSM